MQAEAAHQKSKYEKLNKSFTNMKNSKEETIYLADSPDSESSSISESNNYSPKIRKTSIAYDSNSSDNGKISSIYISSEDNT